MIYGSVCSGIEAASVAWHPLGWKPSFFSEIEAFPRAVLAHHYPEVPLHGDFTTIEAGQYQPIDLLVGGTPCQSFSVAGLRAGLDDDRGNLALEFCRLARRLGPRWVVWENVPGVLSLDEGRAFSSILGGLEECGYSLAYRVLDAQYVRVDGYARAVPQRRQRVFVVGYLGDWRRAAAVLLEPEGLRRDPPPRREEGPNAAYGTLGGTSPGGGWRFGPDEAAAGQLISGPLTAGMAKSASRLPHEQGTLVAFDPTQITSKTNRSNPQPGGPCHTLAKGQQALVIAFGGGRTSGPVDVAATLTAKGMRIDFEVETFIAANNAPVLTSNPYGDHASREGLLVAHTLRADGFGASEDGTGRGTPLVPVAGTLGTRSAAHPSGVKSEADFLVPKAGRGGVRRLTPTECERLQGFPDGYTQVPYRGKPAADGPRYKAIGNSMACNVMRWVGRRIEMMEQ